MARPLVLYAKHTLREEVRDARREERTYCKEHHTPPTPRALKPGELDEEIRKVRCAIGYVGKNR